MATATFVAVAVLPGVDHALARGDHREVAERLRELHAILASDSAAAGTTFVGAWAAFTDPAAAIRAVLRAGTFGAACAVCSGQTTVPATGPPVGRAGWLARELASVARTGETLMPRTTLDKLKSTVPRGVGHHAAPAELSTDEADVVVVRDYRTA